MHVNYNFSAHHRLVRNKSLLRSIPRRRRHTIDDQHIMQHKMSITTTTVTFVNGRMATECRQRPSGGAVDQIERAD